MSQENIRPVVHFETKIFKGVHAQRPLIVLPESSHWEQTISETSWCIGPHTKELPGMLQLLPYLILRNKEEKFLTGILEDGQRHFGLMDYILPEDISEFSDPETELDFLYESTLGRTFHRMISTADDGILLGYSRARALVYDDGRTYKCPPFVNVVHTVSVSGGSFTINEGEICQPEFLSLSELQERRAEFTDMGQWIIGHKLLD